MPRDMEIARAIVNEFVGRPYDKGFWHDMVANPKKGPHGCLCEALATTLPTDRWKEAGYNAAQRLRELYPASLKKRLWEQMDWSPEIDSIISVVDEEIAKCLMAPDAVGGPAEDEYIPDLTVQESGYVPWRPFHRRAPVPASSGVYLLLYCEDVPPPVVSPLSKEVIYIGSTGDGDSEGTIDRRLTEFEKTAHGKRGHSAGWTYATEFAKDYQSVQSFRNTYVSWRESRTTDSVGPRQREAQLIGDYVRQWGERPALNKAD